MRQISFKILVFSAILLSVNIFRAGSCTNYLITRGASVTGSTMITYAADSHVLYGELYYWPAAEYPEGTMLDVYEWDTGKYLGKIRQALKTYNVVGNMNENQVAIGETTYGGRDTLIDETGIIDYGSLIYITLQRATSARDAIKIMAELVAEYGYYSSGESFSISDANEVWIMEMIGKGKGNKGAVWVARRIPDGYVSGHANQARIQTFPQEKDSKTSISSKNLSKLFKPEIETVYAHDVIEVARKFGWFSGKDKDFSFSDVYAPIEFSAARFSEIRVWSFFRAVNEDMNAYYDYVTGHDLSNRMPLWIKPNRKLSNLDLMNFMRDHLEGTPLDMRKDAGAGPFGLPYRWRPLTWSVTGDDKVYLNERATATQQTGFSFVAESRNWLPNPIGGILWFGLDDAATSCYMPMYSSINKVPESLAVGNGDLLTYSPTAAFWIFSYVTNFAYLRYDMMSADIIKVQQELETRFAAEITSKDEQAKKLFEKDPKAAVDFLTEYSLGVAGSTMVRWKALGEYLLVKYMDGNIKKEENGQFLRNPYGNPLMPSQPGYPDSWKKQVIQDTGEKLLVPAGSGH
jgi:dipeptidase